MKRLQLLTVFLILHALSFGQNQSDGSVDPLIATPVGQQFTGPLPSPFAPEIFRFRPGLVTQSDAFTDPMEPFAFDNARWFSIGRLQTSANQTVYGLRFQLPNRAATFGYQDIDDNNPRIQWIGQGQNLGDLEFRMADSFTSTSSDLVATMRSDSGTVFSTINIPFFEDAKIGIGNLNFDKSIEIIQELQSSNPTYSIDATNDSSSPENYGVNARVRGPANQNFGFNAIVEGTAGRNFGYNALVNGEAGSNFGFFADVKGSANERYGVLASSSGEGSINYGVFGSARDASTNFGIYGAVPNTGGFSNNSGDFAGFFDGDIGTTSVGLFVPSDERLKENVSEIEFASDNLMKLKPKMYEYIRSDKINLSQGRQFGFIAQEIEEIFPELIKEVRKPVLDENNEVIEYIEYKSVNYLGLIAILTASIQELNQEVERLKETNGSYVVYSDRLDAEEMKGLERLAYKLEQNYPNPFQGKSVIEYSLPEYEENASIMVFNMTGKLLKEYKLREKSGTIEVNSDDFEPGIYLYSLISNNDEIITKKMIVK